MNVVIGGPARSAYIAEARNVTPSSSPKRRSVGLVRTSQAAPQYEGVSAGQVKAVAVGGRSEKGRRRRYKVGTRGNTRTGTGNNVEAVGSGRCGSNAR